MRSLHPLAPVLLILLMAVSATAELTEYQKGVADGLKVGLFMGRLQERSLYSSDGAKEFNSNLDLYQQWLLKVFSNNQTMIDAFALYPMVYRNPMTSEGPLPDAYGRIGDYPAEAFYTATGSGPTINNSKRDWIGWV